MKVFSSPRSISISSPFLLILLLNVGAPAGFCLQNLLAEDQLSQAPYQIQGGDQLAISVYREEDLTGDYQIDPEGFLNFPLVGRILMKGKTLDAARDFLTTGLKKYLINPQVSISRSENLLKSISILGHVKEAGTFDYAPNTTLMRTISQAGGFLPSANKRKVRIVRYINGAKQSLIINALDIINEDANDVELQPGDMIFVPESIF